MNNRLIGRGQGCQSDSEINFCLLNIDFYQACVKNQIIIEFTISKGKFIAVFLSNWRLLDK